MGKAKKIKLRKAPRNLPLRDQMQKDDLVTPSGRVKERGDARQAENDDEFVDEKLSRQILGQARLQLQELENEAGVKKPPGGVNKISVKRDSDESDEGSDDESGDDLDWGKIDSQLRISQKDESAFNSFRKNPVDEPRRTLADIIMEKVEERKTEINTQYTDAESLKKAELDPRVVEMYEGVGEVLSKYRSGKIPKAFKVIPQFQNWEDLVLLTKPDQWTAAAVLKATKVFVSGLNEKMAQRFFNLLLLPRIRDDIDTYQRLNFHLYQALKKALFKPGAFFKGFLLPLCEAGDCTLREATIIGSVLAKNSIPMLHSSAVLLKIAEMEYTGASSIFIRIFLDKKYALPYRVVDSLVFHFLKFRNEKRDLPVLWHQAFLTFIQRYKGHISSEQRDALMDLCRLQQHYKIVSEIRRELSNAPCRDLEVQKPMDH